MNYSLILPLVYPGAEWSLSDIFDFETLEWGPNNVIVKPSLPDCVAAWAAAQPQEAMRLLREKRNELLQQSDVYVLPDYPHPDDATKQAWLAYRQALRDVPQNSSPQLLTDTLKLDPASVAWPAPPTSS